MGDCNLCVEQTLTTLSIVAILYTYFQMANVGVKRIWYFLVETGRMFDKTFEFEPDKWSPFYVSH